MKCIGYDTEFQRILVRNYRQYEQRMKTKPKSVTSKRKRRPSDTAVVKKQDAGLDADIQVLTKENIDVDSDPDIKVFSS